MLTIILQIFNSELINPLWIYYDVVEPIKSNTSSTIQSVDNFTSNSAKRERIVQIDLVWSFSSSIPICWST